jgi:hypothetical protein
MRLAWTRISGRRTVTSVLLIRDLLCDKIKPLHLRCKLRFESNPYARRRNVKLLPWMDGFWGVETELLHAGHDLGLLCYFFLTSIAQTMEDSNLWTKRSWILIVIVTCLVFAPMKVAMFFVTDSSWLCRMSGLDVPSEAPCDTNCLKCDMKMYVN